MSTIITISNNCTLEEYQKKSVPPKVIREAIGGNYEIFAYSKSDKWTCYIDEYARLNSLPNPNAQELIELIEDNGLQEDEDREEIYGVAVFIFEEKSPKLKIVQEWFSMVTVD
jgi:hypothetical protein